MLKALLKLSVVFLWSTSVASAANKENVDLIVLGRYVVTQDEGRPVIENGAVAVRDGIIVAVDTAAHIQEKYSADEEIKGDDRVLMPGLINGHTHTSMSLFRGLADDLPLMTWLQKYIFPMEGKFVDPDFIRTGMELACWEMIRGGTTSFVDMYFFPDVAYDALEKCGLRAILGSPSIDYSSPGFKGWDDSFAFAVDFIKRKQGKSGRITPAFAPHAPYTVSPEHLKQVADMAIELGAPVTTHLAEDLSEIKHIREKYDTTPVQHLRNLGLLDTQLIAAHVVHPTVDDMNFLATHKVGVIHNPTSNLKTGAGVAPIPEMLRLGIPVGLGTDGAASNNDLNIWEEIRLAALIHKGVSNDPTVMSAATVLKMATSGGAQAVGLDDVVGALVVGKRADMIQVGLNGPHLTPVYDVISHLVYAVNANDVVTTIVDGHILMRDQKILTLDTKKIQAEAAEIARKISLELKAD